VQISSSRRVPHSDAKSLRLDRSATSVPRLRDPSAAGRLHAIDRVEIDQGAFDGAARPPPFRLRRLVGFRPVVTDSSTPAAQAQDVAGRQRAGDEPPLRLVERITRAPRQTRRELHFDPWATGWRTCTDSPRSHAPARDGP